MALSSTLKNRIVGFVIVASTFLIFLPIILSKDILQYKTEDAVAINQNGALLDDKGQLVHQSQANQEQIFNSQEGTLNLGQVNTQNNQTPPLQEENEEILSFSKPNSNNNDEGELLVAPAKPNVQDTTTNHKNIAQAEEKVEEKVTVKEEVVAKAPSKNNGPKVIAGSKPSERYVIQVGVFSRRANAENVINKLKGANIHVYAISVDSNGRELFRVYASKSNNRNELNGELQKINKLCGTTGKVIAL